MSYRDRRDARAERLREWADKREAKAAQVEESTKALADSIPFGQPILVGHHSEGKHRRDADRIHRGTGQAIEHRRKAAEFRRKADEIEAQATRSVYSDDDDAAEKLRERIAEREHERAVKKAANAAARKGLDWTAEVGPELWPEGRRNFAHWPGGTEIPFPDLKNLSAAIRRDRKRLEGMES